MTKNYDIAIYGASAFTGQLAARTLSLDPFLKIILAGRNRTKLEALQKKCKGLPDIFVSEAHDRARIRELVMQSRVVLNFAGPFVKHAETLIATCAELGKHYCDITGETVFLAEMIAKYQELALASGSTLIPMAGFDSVPADITGYLAIKAARQNNLRLHRLDHIYAMRGGFNGGTLETTLSFGELSIKDRYLDENVIIPDASWPRTQAQDEGPRYEKRVQSWTAPFFMHTTNAPLYRRARYLAGDIEYAAVPYFERMAVARGPIGYLGAVVIENAVRVILWAIDSHLGRRILRALGPAPGEGPSESSQRRGFYEGTLIGRDESKDRVIVKLRAKGDPGNILTVLFATEIAKILAEEQSAMKGFTTATLAFGETFLDRLKAKGVGMSIEIH